MRPVGADVLVNPSVWESREALWNFVYRSAHLEALRRRREWFRRHVDAHQALWWVPAGRIPTVEEAVERLELLRERGPSPSAFTFRDFSTPEGVPEGVRPDVTAGQVSRAAAWRPAAAADRK